jgi:hypothetical protein
MMEILIYPSEPSYSRTILILKNASGNTNQITIEIRNENESKFVRIPKEDLQRALRSL